MIINMLNGKKLPEITVCYRQHSKAPTLSNIAHAEHAYRAFLTTWNKNALHLQQQLRIMFLNRANFPLGIYTHTTGVSGSTLYDTRLIISVALKIDTHAIIIAQNHPSGCLEPSDSEKQLCKKLKKAAGYFDIMLLDYLILSDKSYFSFVQNNLIKQDKQVSESA